MNIVTREEKIFLISIEEFRNKSHYLDSLMIQDEHNGIDGYIIRSLYFFCKRMLRSYALQVLSSENGFAFAFQSTNDDDARKRQRNCNKKCKTM